MSYRPVKAGNQLQIRYRFQDVVKVDYKPTVYSMKTIVVPLLRKDVV